MSQTDVCIIQKVNQVAPTFNAIKRRRVLVIGCGVIGLSSAIELQRAGHIVDIWAKDIPPHTTSNKAGAYWYPYNIHPANKVQRWAQETYHYYDRALYQEPRAGIRQISSIHFHNEPHTEKMFYESFVASSRHGQQDELPNGIKGAEVLMTFSIDVDRCLEYFFSMFLQNGGRVTQKMVHNFSEIDSEYEVIVNCTGFGAKALCGDKTVFAARGQTVLVKDNGHANVASLHTKDIAYIIPRGPYIVLGGTFQEGNESLLIDPKDTKEILEKCEKLYPWFSKDKLEVVCEKVGLRPCRPEVRLEKEMINGKLVVHNYGHGGAGWTVFYGCAKEVTMIVNQHLTKAKL